MNGLETSEEITLQEVWDKITVEACYIFQGTVRRKHHIRENVKYVHKIQICGRGRGGDTCCFDLPKNVSLSLDVCKQNRLGG